MIKAIVFDCFGVVITDVFRAMHDELRSRDPQTADKIDGLVDELNRGTLPRPDFMNRVSVLFGISTDELRTRVESTEAKNKAVFEYILELRKHYKTAMLTNLSPEGFGRRFTQEEMNTYFDAVVLSGEIGYIKPEPEAYEITAEKLGVQLNECVMVDDRQICITGAEAVGMQGVLYDNLQQFKADLAKLIA